MDITNIIQSIPKTEIHNHILALASERTLNLLNQKYSLFSHEVFTRKVKSSHTIQNLSQMIEYFFFIVSFFKHEEDIVLLINDVFNYMKKHNIFYAEFYFDPTALIKRGLSFKKMVAIFDQEIPKYQNVHRKLALLIGVSRMFGTENSMNILNMVLENRRKYIIGIDLGGKERGNPARLFTRVFEKARKYGLHVVAHAGEEVGPASIWSAIRDLKVERIGHATSAFKDERLMRYLFKNQIPLEICPTSSIITRAYVETIEKHPIQIYIQKGLFVTVNSDDPIIFKTDITKEYVLLTEKLNLSLSKIVQLIRNGINATFLPIEEKMKWQQRITDFTGLGIEDK